MEVRHEHEGDPLGGEAVAAELLVERLVALGVHLVPTRDPRAEVLGRVVRDARVQPAVDQQRRGARVLDEIGAHGLPWPRPRHGRAGPSGAALPRRGRTRTVAPERPPAKGNREWADLIARQHGR